MDLGDRIASGRAALADGRWADAKEAFATAAAADPSPDALDGLGRALWWLKEVGAALDARARAYAEYRREGRFEEAAVTAVWLAREHRALYRSGAAADGWLARAERSGERLGNSLARGWLLSSASAR